MAQGDIAINTELYDEGKLVSVLKELSALLTLNEAKVLLELGKKAKANGVILEIGSYTGGSTVLLARGSREGNNVKVYAIDPHVEIGLDGRSTLISFKENIERAGVGELVVTVVKTSSEAERGWKHPISLLWIDGAHDYANVKNDFLTWEKHLVNGGTIAFHDAAVSHATIPATGKAHHIHYEPRRVVAKYVAHSKRFKGLKTVDTLVYAIKVENAGRLESVKHKVDLVFARLGIINGSTKLKLKILLKKYAPLLHKSLKNLKEKQNTSKKLAKSRV